MIMKKKQHKKKNLILLLVLFMIVEVLLTITLLNGALDDIYAIPQEILTIICVFLILLPILILILFLAWLFDKKFGKNKTVSYVTSQSFAVSDTSEESVSNRAIPTQQDHTEGALIHAQSPIPEKNDEVEAEDVLEEGASRFCMLSIIDENRASYKEKKFHSGITLKKFCEDLRNYASYKHKLYYDIKDIRRFVSGMAVSQILILQGMSGTGKTSLAHVMGAFLENTSTVIPVQPMWKERTDLLGYYNEFTKRFNETLLLEKMYEANYSDDIYVTVLDEMNIARVEYYFAEFLSLLELPDPDERYIDVVSDVWDNDPLQFKSGRLKLPYNMWFIGTANNDDSTFAISDKVYDRAMILNLDEKSESFKAPKTEPTHMSADNFRELVNEALVEYEITGRNLKRLEALDRYLIDHFHITFGNRIMKQIRQYIPVYVSCGGSELEALDDILSKKIIRKLETQNPVYLRTASEDLCVYINELFGADRMPLCQNAIRRLEQNA